MSFELRQLSPNDGADIYNMLQELPKDENGFINGCNGKTYDEYKKWLINSDDIENGIGLEDWMVPESIYWLYVDGVPVGMGKFRHYLTDKLREEGGHAGYAVHAMYRNRGYGTELLKLLVARAKERKIDKVLLTIKNHNIASIKVATANNGTIEKVDDVRHFIWIDTSRIL